MTTAKPRPNHDLQLEDGPSPRTTRLQKRHLRRMLVVEDDRDLGQIVGRVVASVDQALAVDVASTAREARCLLATKPYEFVLLDYFLDDGEQGIDLLALIRETQPVAGIAMMSCLELERLLEVTADERGLQILPKPFSLLQLKAFLYDVLEQVGPRSVQPVH